MRPCIFLLAAGLLDAILTNIGISTGLVKEGNPMMSQVIDKGWTYFYFIKIILPLMLLGVFYLKPFIGRVRKLLLTTCVLYLAVLVYHMVWIILYLKTTT